MDNKEWGINDVEHLDAGYQSGLLHHITRLLG